MPAGVDPVRLWAAALFFAAAAVVFLANLLHGGSSLPFLPVAVGVALVALAHPTAVAARADARAERAQILAELEARDVARSSTE